MFENVVKSKIEIEIEKKINKAEQDRTKKKQNKGRYVISTTPTNDRRSCLGGAVKFSSKQSP